MEITCELVKKLKDENITKKEYERIVSAINDKVDEVWKFICEISRREIDWYAFSNDVSYGHGNGSSGGEFDPDNDAEWIELIGEYEHSDNDFYKYDSGFPTELLWSKDYKSIVIDHTEEAEKKLLDFEKKKKKQNQDKKIHKEALKKSIKSKLTKEELAIISFK